MALHFLYKIIDLTHSLDENTPSWDGGRGFTHESMIDYEDCQGDVSFRAQKIHMDAGIGTHIDAPAHIVPGGATVDMFEPLLFPCVCIDVSEKMRDDYVVSKDDIELFEKNFGRINDGSFVLVYTGWDRHWREPKKYHNDHLFPSLSIDVADMLCKRSVAGIGIDTLSPDLPESGFPVHKRILGSGKYIVENVANAAVLPPVGAFVLVAPLKAVGLTEAPVRLIGLVKYDS